MIGVGGVQINGVASCGVVIGVAVFILTELLVVVSENGFKAFEEMLNRDVWKQQNTSESN